MKRAVLVGLALALSVPHAFAESEADCLARWRTADADGNGALEKGTDNEEYVAAMKGKSPVSRDDFLRACERGAFAALRKPGNPAESKDLGKGDITPGAALSKDDALKKLKASGFGDVNDLEVADKGVWRGAGVANGKTVSVAVDPQGDIVAK